MRDKWIPNGHLDCVMMVERFARTIGDDPARFFVSPEDAQILSDAAVQYRAAFQADMSAGRSSIKNAAKKQARVNAVKIVQRLGNLVRANDKIDWVSKRLLDIHERAKNGKAPSCPLEAPRLRFLRALHEGSAATPVHELEFRAKDFSKARPPGADRLELFVDLIPPDEPIPAHPVVNQGSRPWYLRSYSRSPIRLIPPMARVLMRVVYWGRWADKDGNVGPFSATAVAWIEGNTNALLPGGVGLPLGNLGARKPVKVLEDARPIGPESRNESYRIAIIEVQSQSMNPQNPDAALPAPPEMRQLEGSEKEAA